MSSDIKPPIAGALYHINPYKANECPQKLAPLVKALNAALWPMIVPPKQAIAVWAVHGSGRIGNCVLLEAAGIESDAGRALGLIEASKEKLLQALATPPDPAAHAWRAAFLSGEFVVSGEGLVPLGRTPGRFN